MGSPLRAVEYHRVSRHDQDPRLQDDATKQFIAGRRWKLVDTYVDHGVSGSRETRPELGRLLADARRGRFDIIVVYKADRLFRSLRHMVVTLDELASLNVGFVATSEPVDTSTPSGRLLLHVISSMAEFERSILIERTKAGLAAARRRGVHIGRPSVKLDIEQVMALRATGASLRSVGRSLGVGPATVHRALAAARDPEGPTNTPSATP